MCGISGIITRSLGRDEVARRLARMGVLQRHRGPDDQREQVFEACGRRVGLGLVRLAILDLETGMQPIVCPSDGTAIICNGQIYNYVELRRELSDQPFVSRGDIETALHAYRKKGLDFLNDLNGMYGGAIYDPVHGRVVLFRDRFGMIFRLNSYSCEELAAIVRRSARILALPITESGSREIAARSRGTPRIANRLLRRVGDYALVRSDGRIDEDLADEALTMLGVDRNGLDETDRRILRVIVEDFGGGPVGIKTIAISIGEDVRTIEEVYEPYLIQSASIKRTPQGREATPAARSHIQPAWW